MPYVYVMMKNSDSNPTVADKLAKHKVKLSTQEELDKLPLFLDYDEAIKARDELLANKTLLACVYMNINLLQAFSPLLS